MNWWNVYLIVFSFTILLSLVLTPIFRIISVWTNTLDKPATQNHKNHTATTPLMGGFAMCAAWLITLLVVIYSPTFLAKQNCSQLILNNLAGVFQVQSRLLAILIGGVLITLLGFIDDKRHMSAKAKLLSQVVIVTFVVWYGDLRVTLFIHNHFINIVLAVFWIVTVINAINFFDNMDGLAVGIATIAFVFFSVTAMIYHHYFIACLSLVGVGTTLGFWFYNHSPASIFMGDSGSHFLGYILGVTGALTTYYREGITITHFSVLIPIFILAIPIFDLFSVVIIRLKIKKPIYIGDNNHISHRFCKMGMSRKNAVFCVYILSIIIGLSILPLLWGDRLTATVCLLQAFLLLTLVSGLQYAARKQCEPESVR